MAVVLIENLEIQSLAQIPDFVDRIDRIENFATKFNDTSKLVVQLVKCCVETNPLQETVSSLDQTFLVWNFSNPNQQ